MATLNLFNFNNYYDRVSKYFATLQEYTENGLLLYSWQDRNFNPSDGVATNCILNYSGAQPDYCIVTNTYGDIVSRWFVIEARRTTGGQYMVTLLRDLVADYRQVVLSNPCFIEKATLDIRDPLLFNKENMTFNQIRKEQTMLYDNSKCPWIVGYVPKDTTLPGSKITGNIAVTPPKIDFTVDGIENWEYKSLVGRPTIAYSRDYLLRINLNYVSTWQKNLFGYPRGNYVPAELVVTPSGVGYSKLNESAATDEYYSVSELTELVDEVGPIFGAVSTSYSFVYANTTRIEEQIVASINNIPSFKTKLTNSIENSITTAGISVIPYVNLMQLKDKVIYDSSTNKYYKISLSTTSDYLTKVALTSSLYAEIRNRIFINPLQGYDDIIWPEIADEYIKGSLTVRDATISLEVIQVETQAVFQADLQNLLDAPYKMFCIPYGAISCTLPDNSTFEANAEIGLSMACSLSTQLGSANIWDIQLLPYCPIRGAFKDGKLQLARVQYTPITSPDGSIIYSVFCWCTESNFSFIMSDNQIPMGTTALERKVNSETVMYRLCSPNGAGMFELDPELNDGVSAWEVNCTYKPFQPFIQIKPVFGGLYGIETQTDYRGLICGGDFSLPQLSDAWANYQLNNKTYQEQFDREIQNLKVNQNVARAGEAYGLLKSAVGGFVSGASRGAQAGPVGMVAGALFGEAAAGVNSLVNTAMNETIREETLDYKQDLFGFQLANIKAIPQSITKTAANVINNPLVPYIEKYECTEEERQALIDKLYYNGMTVGRIGYINNYLRDKPTYIKGKLIRTVGLQDDYHIAEALANEINKGVFL